MAVEWFYFALLSSVLISGVNIIDKILISDYKIPPLVYVLVISATSLMPLVTLAFFHITPLPLGILAFTILVGFVRIYYTLPYFKALMVEEVSRVIPLLQLTPVFVLILSSVVLHEALRPQDYVAFGLLVLGGTLFAIRLTSGIRISLAFYLMILASFLLALYSVALKYLFSVQDFYTIFIWVQIAGFITFFQFIPFRPFRSSLVTTYKITSRQIGIIIVAEQAVAYVSVFAYNYAIAHGPYHTDKLCWRDTAALRVIIRDNPILSISSGAEGGTYADGYRLEGARAYCDLCRNVSYPVFRVFCNLMAFGLHKTSSRSRSFLAFV